MLSKESTEQCHYAIDANFRGVVFDVRTIVSIVTHLLAPAYTLLSVVVILSRYNSVLKLLSSHGKTCINHSGTGTTAERTTASSPSWCWISKRYFAHFYLIGLVSIAAATNFQWNSMDKNEFDHLRSSTSATTTAVTFRTYAVFLLVIHLLRRAYECIYVQQYRRGSSKMHIAGYGLGLGYYLILPLVFWEFGRDVSVSNAVEGSIGKIHDDSPSLFLSNISLRTKNEMFRKTFLVVVISFNLWMQYEQHAHHDILAGMRRVVVTKKPRKVGEDDKVSDGSRDVDHCNYSLPPPRRWFRYVLSPHYLAEILLYLSFAILLETAARYSPDVLKDFDILCANATDGLNAPSRQSFHFRRITSLLSLGRRHRHWALLVWVATNLVVSALNSYDWYLAIYKTTGKGHTAAGSASQRKAIIPMFL